MDVKRSAGQRNRDKVKGEDMELTKMYGELGISGESFKLRKRDRKESA